MRLIFRALQHFDFQTLRHSFFQVRNNLDLMAQPRHEEQDREVLGMALARHTVEHCEPQPKTYPESRPVLHRHKEPSLLEELSLAKKLPAISNQTNLPKEV